jgi:hypothetical protein
VIFELLDQYNDFQFALIEPKRGASAKLMMGETDTFFSNVRVIDREWITLLPKEVDTIFDVKL